MNMVEIARSPIISLDSNAIQNDPGPFCMSYEPALGPLIRSIQEFGLINPPIVVRQGEGRVDVVSGYRRILALKDLQLGEIPCRDATDSGLSSLQLLLLNLHENYVTREFNDVEKAMILARFVHYLSREKVIQSYMPLLSLPSRESTLDLYLNMERQTHTIKRALAKGEVSVKSFEALMDLEPGFRSGLIKSMLNLKLTFNQQLQFIEFTVDICRRDGIDVPELFNQTSFVGVMENERLNPPQKAKAILGHLKSIRLPRLTRSEESFRRAVSELGLPDGTQISHSPFFEGPDYRLEVSFKNGKQLKDRITVLNTLEKLEALADPWQDEER